MAAIRYFYRCICGHEFTSVHTDWIGETSPGFCVECCRRPIKAHRTEVISWEEIERVAARGYPYQSHDRWRKTAPRDRIVFSETAELLPEEMKLRLIEAARSFEYPARPAHIPDREAFVLHIDDLKYQCRVTYYDLSIEKYKYEMAFEDERKRLHIEHPQDREEVLEWMRRKFGPDVHPDELLQHD